MGIGLNRYAVSRSTNLETLDLPAVFDMFTFDYASGGQHNREMIIEISRWGNRAQKNAQYVLQPFYVAANVHRLRRGAPEQDDASNPNCC